MDRRRSIIQKAAAFGAALMTVFFANVSSVRGAADHGGTCGGGGQSVVLSKDEVHFLDLLPENWLRSNSPMLVKHSDVLQMFFYNHPYVRHLAKSDTNFFDCATQQFRKYLGNSLTYERVKRLLSETQVMQVEFPLHSLPQNIYQQLDLAAPYFASDSARLVHDDQQTLAAYADNQLWVSRPLYEKMNGLYQCGLAVHESFRQINFAEMLEVALTTDEIELATRLLMGRLDADIDTQAAIKNVETKISHVKPGESLYDQADAADEKANKLRDELSLKKLTAKRARQLNQEISDLQNQSDNLRTGGVAASLSHPIAKQTIRLGIRNIFMQWTEELPANQYWDIRTLQKVNRDQFFSN